MKRDFFKLRKQQSYVERQKSNSQVVKNLHFAPSTQIYQQALEKGFTQLSNMNNSRKQNIKDVPKIDGIVQKKPKYTHFPKSNQLFLKRNHPKKIQRFSFQQNIKTEHPTDWHIQGFPSENISKRTAIPQITFTYQSKKTHHGLIQTQRVIANQFQTAEKYWKITPRTTGSFSEKENSDFCFETPLPQCKTLQINKKYLKSKMLSNQAQKKENPQYQQLFNEFMKLFKQDDQKRQLQVIKAIQECEKLFLD